VADVARLEYARWQALYAADAAPMDAQALAHMFNDAGQASHLTLQLHPSLTVLTSAYPVVSLWLAHQGHDEARDAALAQLDLARGEAALVFRIDDQARVLALPLADAALALAIQRQRPLGDAVAAHGHADLSALLQCWLGHGLIVNARTSASPVPLNE
jgi:hypothetical protein